MSVLGVSTRRRPGQLAAGQRQKTTAIPKPLYCLPRAMQGPAQAVSPHRHRCAGCYNRQGCMDVVTPLRAPGKPSPLASGSQGTAETVPVLLQHMQDTWCPPWVVGSGQCDTFSMCLWCMHRRDHLPHRRPLDCSRLQGEPGLPSQYQWYTVAVQQQQHKHKKALWLGASTHSTAAVLGKH